MNNPSSGTPVLQTLEHTALFSGSQQATKAWWIATLPGASHLQSETGQYLEGKRDTGASRVVGAALISKGNLCRWLVWSANKMNGSWHPSAKPYKLLQRPDQVWSCISCRSSRLTASRLCAWSSSWLPNRQAEPTFQEQGKGQGALGFPGAAQGSTGGHVPSLTSPNRAILGWSPFQLKFTGLSIVQHIIMKDASIGTSKALYLKYAFQRLDRIFKRKSKL